MTHPSGRYWDTPSHLLRVMASGIIKVQQNRTTLPLTRAAWRQEIRKEEELTELPRLEGDKALIPLIDASYRGMINLGF